MSEYFELLNSNVYDKKNIVTYRWLSRKLNVNVNQAKKILYEFKINENDKIHCVYCISGPLKENNELSIVLIPEEQLEDTKKKFEHTFIHIYSIEARNLKELDPLVAENYDIINNTSDNPQDYSMVHCSAIHKKEKPIESASIDDEPNIKPEPVISSINSHNSIKEIKKEKNDFFKKTTNNKNNNKHKDAKATFFDKFKTKSVFEVDSKSTKQKPVKKEQKNSMDMFLKDSSSNVIVEKISNIKLEENKENAKENVKIAESPKEEEEEEEEEMMEVDERDLEREKELEEENEKLKHLFDDDDLFTPISNPTNKKFVIEDDDDDDDDDDENNNINIIKENEQKPKNLVKSDDTRKPGRKRYRVTKSKTYVDERGYLVTEDVSDWESVSESEETIVKPKQKSLFDMRGNNNKRSSTDDIDNNEKKAKKRKSNHVTEKTQKSILSFFGKN